MGALTRDLRLAVRVLRKAPAFTVTAIITLALGIGANTAMFTVAQSVLWRPLAYAEPNRLVVLSGRGPVLSPLEIAEIQRSAKSFAEVGAYSNVSVTLSGTAEPERVAGASVSANWFRLLGRKPLLGRGFLTEDGQPGHGGVVVLSHPLWRRRFGADPGTIGRPLRINGESLTVVGVMPADLERVSDEDLWMPLVFSAADLSSGRTYLRAYARLRPGVSIGQARAELESISRGLERQHPESNAGRSLHLAPLQETLVSSARSPLLLLLGAVGFLMLLVCANLTHLELARAAA
jgi:predicted permease